MQKFAIAFEGFHFQMFKITDGYVDVVQLSYSYIKHIMFLYSCMYIMPK